MSDHGRPSPNGEDQIWFERNWCDGVVTDCVYIGDDNITCTYMTRDSGSHYTHRSRASNENIFADQIK